MIHPTPLPERINHCEERKPVKPGVPSADPADPVLAHENRRVEVVHLVAANVRQCLHRLLKYRRVATRREKQGDPRRSHQSRDKATGLSRMVHGERKTQAVGAGPKELIADVPGDEGRRRTRVSGILDPAAAWLVMLGILVRTVEKHVRVEYQHSLALHHPVQLFAVRDVHSLATALPRGERRQRFRITILAA